MQDESVPLRGSTPSRKIKFRAWDECHKIMHHDFQWVMSGEDGNDWILFVSDRQPIGGSGTVWSENPFLAQQLKIMQFTGLKDKNGREIYEGDIARIVFSQDEGGGCFSHQKGQGIVYFDDYWGVKFNCKDHTQRTASAHWGCIGTHECRKVEVIGNRYEHPELLTPKGGG